MTVMTPMTTAAILHAGDADSTITAAMTTAGISMTDATPAVMTDMKIAETTVTMTVMKIAETTVMTIVTTTVMTTAGTEEPTTAEMMTITTVMIPAGQFRNLPTIRHIGVSRISRPYKPVNLSLPNL